eukprot:CAMPEP_0172453078 /NCGR_PEP_ID=MMETSP1065-20121228/10553_1 /TAXON_ID=265537 /ORGANISM="Amphiprora paludosa, Strain CCMP125" /LENGTH=77 /DNA_ID=CAMNT_0013205241 /DNA_START=13 /DNA_END=246 /DNA_ORIENTATION=+
MGFVYLFAWFYLPEQQQRTLILYTAIIHFISGTYQWHWLEGLIANTSNLQMVDFTIAALGLLIWLAPSSISWKKKIE